MIKFSRPQFDFFNSHSSRNLFYSGQGGGKTHIAGPLAYRLAKECPEIIGLISANTYGQLSNSTLVNIFKTWKEDFAWTEYDVNGNPDGYYVVDKQTPPVFKPHGHTFKSNQNKIFLRNGGVIFTASLDNYKPLDGMTIGWAILDETKDTREAAVKEVIIGRLRQLGMYVNREYRAGGAEFQFTTDKNKSGGDVNPLFVLTSPAKEQWLSELFKLEEHREEITACIFSKTDYFYKVSDNRTIVICSAYHNEKNLPSGYIENKILDLSPELVGTLVYGDPFGKSGGEYYSSFKKSNHIRKVDHTPDLPIHLTWDFNVNPYMPATVWQVVPPDRIGGGETRTKVRCLGEYALTSPKNTIEDVCRRFMGEYGHLCEPGLFFYGDASGKNTQPLKEQRNYYEVIEKELRSIISASSKRLLKSNPRHRAIMAGTLGRRDFMNTCLNGRYGFDIEIDESCRHLIADLEFMKEDANGAKEKLKAEINGVVCEKYGHMSDSMDSMVCWIWGDYRKG